MVSVAAPHRTDTTDRYTFTYDQAHLPLMREIPNGGGPEV